MPTPDLIQGVPLPTYDDPAAIPDDLANVFYANLSRGIPRFSTTAQRDAAYPSPVDGQHCWIAAENAVYVRTGGQWQRMWPTVATGAKAVAITGAQTVVTPFTFGRTLPFTPSLVVFQAVSTGTYQRGAAFAYSGTPTATQVEALVITYPSTPAQLGNLSVGWVAYA